MNKPKISELVAIMAWGSVFLEGWALLLGKIPSDVLSWSFFAFFLIVAILASAVASR